jgi:Putative peptidoglycan binding domain
MKRLTFGLLTFSLALSLAPFASADPPHQRHGHPADRTQTVDRNSFAIARSHVNHGAHPRSWWVAHYPHTRFILLGGGYYYWWGGYWYPAYGYDPAYSAYAYGEPIYGYNNYAPGRVIENVQAALRNQGFYRGTVDGLVGPETRSALATFQRSHGLVATAAIDQPTLAALGLA